MRLLAGYIGLIVTFGHMPVYKATHVGYKVVMNIIQRGVITCTKMNSHLLEKSPSHCLMIRLVLIYRMRKEEYSICFVKSS
jgi:hypothetical protein